MIIEIKGISFVNKGAQLMLCAILEQVERHWPEANIVLEPRRNSPYLERARYGALQKLSFCKSYLDLNRFSYVLPQRLRQLWIRKWGIVTEADIDVVLDASGFAYGDQWSSMTIRHLAAELKRYERFGKKYIILPQALGPFTRAQDVKSLQQALPRATLVCARDQTSLTSTRAVIGDSVNLRTFPDFTNLVKGVVPAYYHDGGQKILIIPNNNMLRERNSHARWQDNYLRILIDAVTVIRDMGYLPVLLNHEGEQDALICQQIQEKFNHKLELITESDPLKVKGIIGASKAVICSRFHGCVSALSQGIPCLGTSWSHKYENLFKDYNKLDSLISPTTSSEQLKQMLEKSIEQISDEKYVQAIAKARKKAEFMWQLVATKI